MSEVKVNKISPRTACGTTTLGNSGDTFTLPSGATMTVASGATITNSGTATGFGRTGTVDWDTSIHTGTVTAATGKGYFVNTTAGGVTVNLPVAAVGSIVAVSDYASTAATNNITVAPNGSENINGANEDYTISTAGLAVTLVYADATRGWKSVTGSAADATGTDPQFVAATGGTPCAGTTCGDYKIHSFTAPGTLCVSAAGNACGNNKIDFLVVAGGGGGGFCAGGGGGAGGYRESKQPGAPWTASPIVATPCSGTNGITASVSGYPIVVGGGGAGSTASGSRGTSGALSSFSTICSAGGGGGGSGCTPVSDGVAGGSGGGARAGKNKAGGAGNTPPVAPAQGFAGGLTGPSPYSGCNAGGGGGATAQGVDSQSGTPAPTMGAAGDGATTCISGSPTAYSGGGGGPANNPGTQGGVGGAGGGGTGATYNPYGASNNGVVNTGGGAGGGGSVAGPTGACGMLGGSGIVIIRYKFQ